MTIVAQEETGWWSAN